MHKLPKDIGETRILARFLSGRYGALALARAAGEAANAQRRGDIEQSVLWRHVIANLRQTIAFMETT